MKVITFDIETSNIFQDVGTNDATDLDLSVVCIHDSETGEYSSYTQEQLSDLWPILEKADILVGYNSDHFDVPLLNKYCPNDLNTIKSLDLLKEIRASLGRRIKLDDIAKGTLGESKSADGLLAVKWWREGHYQKVIDYCIQDVKVTRDVYNYAIKNGHVKYYRGPELVEIPLDTSNWEKLNDSEEETAPTLF